MAVYHLFQSQCGSVGAQPIPQCHSKQQMIFLMNSSLHCGAETWVSIQKDQFSAAIASLSST